MTDPSTANIVFREAVDCFCASVLSSSLRLKLAEDIGAHFNISREKVPIMSLLYIVTFKSYSVTNPVCELVLLQFNYIECIT